jgi:hypothetical protein
MAVLLEASSSQRRSTAIHSAETIGKRKRQTEHPTAPTRK